MISIKQSEMFIDRYMDRYAKEGEDSKQTSERVVFTGIVADPKKEYQALIEGVEVILGKKFKSRYTHRNGRINTLGKKIVDGLWLNYGPKCLDEEGNVKILDFNQ